MKVFVDTSAWLALFIQTERLHTSAIKQHKHYQDIPAYFFTNEFVLSELYTRMVYDCGARALKRTIKAMQKLIDDGDIAVYTSNPTIITSAQEYMVKYAEHKISFADATIIACIKLYKLDEVFTFDSDFTKVGITTSQ